MLELKDAIIILIKGLDLVLNNSSPAETHTHTRARLQLLLQTFACAAGRAARS